MISASVAKAKAEAMKAEKFVEFAERTLSELIENAAKKGETQLVLDGGEFGFTMADYGFNIGRKKPYADEKAVRKILKDAGYNVKGKTDSSWGRGYWEYTVISW